MVNTLTIDQPSFCLPIIEHSGRISLCGLHTLIANTLFVYMVVFGVIWWAYSRRKPIRGTNKIFFSFFYRSLKRQSFEPKHFDLIVSRRMC